MSMEAKKFIVYKASAGSGKTYTLVQEYLKIVLANPDKYRRVLAVTFTNKAAFEMKNRIVKYLLQLSEITNSEDKEVVEKIKLGYRDLIETLMGATGLKVEALSARADLVLKKILHNYSDFAICTIDSFVQRIIRTFAFDMKIPQNFEVELDYKNVLSQAVDVLLSYATQDDSLTDLMVEFIKQKISEGKNWDIEQDLKTFAEELMKEDTQKFLPLMAHFTFGDFKAIISKGFGRRRVIADEAEGMAKKVVGEIGRLGIDIASFYYGTKGIPSFFEKVVNNGLGKASLGSTYYGKTVDEGNWYSKTASPTDKQGIDSLKNLISEGYHRILALQVQYKNITVITRSLYPLSLLNVIKAEVEAVKSSGNLIFISDFYQKIHEQLLNEPVPFIYQRTGEKYEHFFIDEFQDTSVLQFQNMLPLIENSLATANTNLVVGDGKQAIYRWRNGEVMQFASLPKIFNKPDLMHYDDIEDALERNYCDYTDTADGGMNVNFRSQAAIVNFNNKIFNYLSDLLSDEHKSIYHQIEQNVKKGNDGGYVQVRFFEKDDYAENQLNCVLEIVQGLVRKGIALKSIAVICRKNSETVQVATHLLKNEIDVVSSESLLLSASMKINLVVALLRFLNNPSDNLSAAFVLFYVNQNHNPEETTNKVFDDYKELQQKQSGFGAMAAMLKGFGVDINFEGLASLSLFDLNEEIVRLFGLLREADPFVVFYLDAVNQFMQKNTATIYDFLAWWDEFGMKKSIVIPEELNAVKIMTIHKAKGQEFPVVIYPFADINPSVKNASAWVMNTDENIPELPAFRLQIGKDNLAGTSYENYYTQEKSKVVLDMLNVCYVAFTRAEEQLYILTQYYPDSSTSSAFGTNLKAYLKKEQLWDEEKMQYDFGDPDDFKAEADETSAVASNKFHEALISSDWTKKLVIRYNSPLAMDYDIQDKRLAWGNLVHEILSEMHDTNDMEKVIAATAVKFLLDAEDVAKIQELISKVMAKPEIAAFFVPGLKVVTEAEILTPENTVYRPDRIIFEAEKNIVIDFKTGSEEDKHKEQVKNYASLLTSINNKQTEKFLLYLNEEIKLVKSE